MILLNNTNLISISNQIKQQILNKDQKYEIMMKTANSNVNKDQNYISLFDYETLLNTKSYSQNIASYFQIFPIKEEISK